VIQGSQEEDGLMFEDAPGLQAQLIQMMMMMDRGG
jgi:hypothetical protein